MCHLRSHRMKIHHLCSCKTVRSECLSSEHLILSVQHLPFLQYLLHPLLYVGERKRLRLRSQLLIIDEETIAESVLEVCWSSHQETFLMKTWFWIQCFVQISTLAP